VIDLDNPRVEPMNDETVYANPLLGFRTWKVRRSGLLASIGAGNSIWKPGVNIARCPSKLHAAPAHDCHCGFYAYHQLQACSRQADLIIGAVAGRGRVEVHADGWRGEEVVILAIADTHPAAQRLARHYKVPLVPYQELAAFSSQFAQPVPATERPRWYRKISHRHLYTAAFLALLGLLITLASGHLPRLLAWSIPVLTAFVVMTFLLVSVNLHRVVQTARRTDIAIGATVIPTVCLILIALTEAAVHIIS
jgi:hypothetical protein